MNTMKIEISDGVLSYTGELRGEWTLEQIRSAFADGYTLPYTGYAVPDGAVIECLVRRIPEGGEWTFILHADGKGGVHPIGDYPHAVEWQ